ncbi:MAG: iron-containing alcohol dehydrogenase [Nitrospiraceae bacterium]|nr:iron-containing alcohol dehydrogenase [Nitrospiraceae bacterium]
MIFENRIPGERVELRKFVAPEFMFGEGARRLAARYARNFGASKVLIVTDPGIIQAGWAMEVMEGFESAGIPCLLFSALTPNPKAREVEAGFEVYWRERCDMIVSVGGGSVTDCAKGIGILSSNSGHILDFEGVDRIPSPGPPLICIPTTGSSADVSQFAIITDTERRVKIAIISKMLVPDVSLLDPLTYTTMDSALAANTGMDAMTHAFEAFVSTAHSPVTDLFALEAIRLMSANLPPSIENPDDIGLRSKTMLGSLYAGLAFSNASLGLVHAMAHSLGGYMDIPHGQCNAILLGPVMGFNYESARQRYEAIAEAMGLRPGAAGRGEKPLLGALEALKRALKVDTPLGALGVSRSDIPELAINAINDPCLATNPRRPSQKDVEGLYEQAL